MAENNKKITHWSKTEERGSYLGIVLLVSIYKLLGRWILMVVMYPVIFYFYLTGAQARHASLQFLQRNFQYSKGLFKLKKAPNQLDVFKHFLTFGYAAIDKLDALLGKITLKNIRFKNIEIFDEIYEQNRGAVLIGSHLGNIELCRSLGRRRRSKRINVLVFTKHAKSFNKALKKIDPEVDVDLIQVTDLSADLAIMLRERVDNGEYIVIVGDRTSTSSFGRVKYAPFLGEQAAFSEGAFIFAGLMECPVFLLFCLKEEKQNYSVVFEHFADSLKLPRKERKEQLQIIISNYAKRLEFYALRYPYQWYNFYNFWLKDKKEHIKK